MQVEFSFPSQRPSPQHGTITTWTHFLGEPLHMYGEHPVPCGQSELEEQLSVSHALLSLSTVLLHQPLSMQERACFPERHSDQAPQNHDELHKSWPEQSGRQRLHAPEVHAFRHDALNPSGQVLIESGQAHSSGALSSYSAKDRFSVMLGSARDSAAWRFMVCPDTHPEANKTSNMNRASKLLRICFIF